MGAYKKQKESHISFISGVIFFTCMFFLGEKMMNSEENYSEDSGLMSYDYVLEHQDNYQDVVQFLKNEYSLSFDEIELNKDEVLFMNSIYNNKNLTSEDKHVFYGFYSLLKDIQGMDRDYAYEALGNVKVKRVERDSDTSSNTLGDYSYQTKTINIYEEDPDNDILLHEGIHCIFNNAKTASLPKHFTEGMTELLVNEYFSEDHFFEKTSYPYQTSYVKMLCELVGSDTVLNSFVNGDFDIILNEMDKYNKTEFSSHKILNIYEDIYENCDGKSECIYSNEDRWKAYEYIRSIYNKAHPKGENYKDFNYLYELSASPFEESASDFYKDYIFYYGILEKAYFSSELKNTYSNSNFRDYYDISNVKVKSK